MILAGVGSDHLNPEQVKWVRRILRKFLRRALQASSGATILTDLGRYSGIEWADASFDVGAKVEVLLPCEHPHFRFFDGKHWRPALAMAAWPEPDVLRFIQLMEKAHRVENLEPTFEGERKSLPALYHHVHRKMAEEATYMMVIWRGEPGSPVVEAIREALAAKVRLYHLDPENKAHGWDRLGLDENGTLTICG